jgi:hypothetical protein
MRLSVISVGRASVASQCFLLSRIPRGSQSSPHLPGERQETWSAIAWPRDGEDRGSGPLISPTHGSARWSSVQRRLRSRPEHRNLQNVVKLYLHNSQIPYLGAKRMIPRDDHRLIEIYFADSPFVSLLRRCPESPSYNACRNCALVSENARPELL